jgi:hypothetical protein
MGAITPSTTLVVVAGADGGSLGEPVAALQVLSSLGTAISAGVGGAALAWSVHSGHARTPGLRVYDLVVAVVAFGGIVAAGRLPGGERGAAPAKPEECLLPDR